ncbi:MAG TPA: FAD/NAD(P)-binding oxidoreductase [Balneolaceae bacterium]|nr:FAD/NAD(P)-binding oxidoreductase [Balneolaceae bacterium]
MKKLVILGAGTGGTIMVNKLKRALPDQEWDITIIDKEPVHYYQPGFLFIPFGAYKERDVIKPKSNFFPSEVNVIYADIDFIDPNQNRIELANEKSLTYDYLIIATGTEIRPDQIEGMEDGLWRSSIFDFYTLDGAKALARFFETWEGGRLVVNIAEMPIKCPVAPLEFVFLAEAFFTRKGIRDKVEITLATPLSGAFTQPICNQLLSDTLVDKQIQIEPEFNIGRVDNEAKKIVSWDEREIPFDVLVSIPTNMGARVFEKSNMGDELNYIPTDRHTLQSVEWSNIFVIGDAADLPSSKAGSVAHFQSDVLFENFMSVINGNEPKAQFDGHTNCFIESGYEKAFLVDFDYDVQPLPGKYPLPGLGPFALLKETTLNHFGKLGFRWLYWHMMLKGYKIPVNSDFSMRGKIVPEEYAKTIPQE